MLVGGGCHVTDPSPGLVVANVFLLSEKDHLALNL